MGGDIRGAGTDVIKINGVEKLHGCNYSVIPDQIEAGTYMIMAAGTKGNLLIKNVIPVHLEPVTAKLREVGVEVIEYGDSIQIDGDFDLKNVNIKTLPYPGFPTDLQQPMTALLSTVKGTSIVTETVSESRFKYIDELKRMGANISVDGNTAVVKGIYKLMGAEVRATDLRAGAALVIAGLMADGITEIREIQHIERGYEDLVSKLKKIGANVKKV